jgi:nicotinic acid mononucleotide adenylyltransferase
VETLRALAPLGELVLIVGADQCDLRSWREPDEILQLASLAVAPREGYVCAPGANVTDLVMAPVDLSSTTVRERLAEGMGEDAVDPAVLGLIRARGFYGRPPC